MKQTPLLFLFLYFIILLAPLNLLSANNANSEITEPYLIKTEGQLLRFIANSDDHSTILVKGLNEGENYEIFLNALSGQQEVYLDAINFVDQSTQASSYVFTAQKDNYFQFSFESTLVLSEFYISVVSLEQESEEIIKSSGVLEVDPSASNVSLVEDLLMGCGTFDVSSVIYSSDQSTRGVFSNGITNVGLDGGLILATGNISVAVGPNNSPSAVGPSAGGYDPDLSIITGGNINDAAVLEFDFVPQTDVVKFKYVFASEEYCEWVGTFNDVFGFFISGPGINGPFSNNAINIATLPNGQYVSINNVNHNTNAALYTSNTTSATNSNGDPDCIGHPLGTLPVTDELQFDGFTNVLVAEAVVQPFETYHIKLAIGDAIDSAYDSAVFIEQYSFNDGTECLMVEVPEVSGQTNTEICVPVKVNLFDSIVSAQFSVNYNDTLLSFTEAKNLNLENLSLSDINHPSSGDITVSWLSSDNVNGTTVNDQTTIFDLCFQAIGQSGGVTELALSNNPMPVSLSNSLGTNLNLDGNVGTITIIGDLCANDTENPEFSNCPQDIVFDLDLGTCETTVEYTITAQDNCEVDSLILLSGPNTGTNVGYGISTVIWEALDEAGNTAYCTFDVIVNEAPIIPDTIGWCPEDIVNWECYTELTESGYYECTYTSLSGCDSTVALLLEELPTSPSVTSYQTICADDCPYVWNGQEYCDSGIYSYPVTVAGGCESFDTLILDIVTPLAAIMIVEACDSFYWDINGQLYFQSGSYTEVIPGEYCDTTYNLELSVNAITDLSLTVDSGTISTSNTSTYYQWLDCNNGYEPILGANDQSFTPTEAGDYALELVIGACTEITECVNVIPTSTVELGVEELEIYPNPTDGLITIGFNKPSAGLLNIYDLQGKLITSQRVEETESISFHLGSQSGLYLVEFIDEIGEVFLGKTLKVD